MMITNMVRLIKVMMVMMMKKRMVVVCLPWPDAPLFEDHDDHDNGDDDDGEEHDGDDDDECGGVLAAAGLTAI